MRNHQLLRQSLKLAQAFTVRTRQYAFPAPPAPRDGCSGRKPPAVASRIALPLFTFYPLAVRRASVGVLCAFVAPPARESTQASGYHERPDQESEVPCPPPAPNPPSTTASAASTASPPSSRTSSTAS